MTITQEIINNNLDLLIKNSKQYIKPEPTSVIISNTDTIEVLNKYCKLDKSGEYDTILIGELDDVDYNYDDIPLNVGITFSLTSDNKLDVYPNPQIFDTNLFREINYVPNEKLNNKLPNELVKLMKSFIKLKPMNLIKVREFKKLLNINEEIKIEAIWGTQNDVSDKDFILLNKDNSYKIDCDDTTGLPEKYELL